MAPSCFKVLLDPTSPQLPLPSAFVTKYLKNNIPKYPIIRSDNGGYVWKLMIKKIGESYCFANGWSKVVKDARLGIADFLIFELVNDTTFKMKIYSPDGCEKFLIPRNHVEHRSDDHDPSSVSIISNKSHKYVSRLSENFEGLPGIDREVTILYSKQEKAKVTKKPATKVVKRTQGPQTRQHGGRVYVESEDECVEVVKRGRGRPRKQQ